MNGGYDTVFVFTFGKNCKKNAQNLQTGVVFFSNRSMMRVTTFPTCMKREVTHMKKKIIAISRQCGSGGYTIGQELAARLGVPFYDKEYLDTHAHPDENHVQSCTSLLFCLTTGMYDGYILTKGGGTEETSREADLIHRLAEQGPCVFVGRCAEYVLRDRADCLGVFIQGEKDDRVNRMVTEEKLFPDAAQRLIESRDKIRATHYRNLTNGQIWGDPANYDLVLDTTQLGLDRCMEKILEACE